jgi:hypothetical protein
MSRCQLPSLVGYRSPTGLLAKRFSYIYPCPSRPGRFASKRHCKRHLRAHQQSARFTVSGLYERDVRTTKGVLCERWTTLIYSCMIQMQELRSSYIPRGTRPKAQSHKGRVCAKFFSSKCSDARFLNPCGTAYRVKALHISNPPEFVAIQPAPTRPQTKPRTGDALSTDGHCTSTKPPQKR